jgi:phenylacetic acid degradation operon negative regulatory protein
MSGVVAGVPARKTSRAILEQLASGDSLTVRDLSRSLGVNGSDAEALRRRARYLASRGYLAGDARSGYRMTALGRQRLSELRFSRLEQTGKWDRRWRLVIFDIPEAQRPARDAIRRLVKQLGFLPLQHSVWVHPLPCLEEFSRIRASYGLRDRLRLMEVVMLDDELDLIRRFRKHYPDL